MNLSKSKYCDYLQCRKILWLDKNNPNVKEESNNESILDNGTDVGIMARELFPNHINIAYNDDLKVMINDTKNLLIIDKIVITEASFLYKNNFCSVDILKKDGNNYELYEVKSSTEIKDIYYDDLAYQVYVLTSIGYNVTKASIIYINSNYSRKGDLKLNELFNIEDITDLILSKQEEVENNINEIEKYLTTDTELDEVDLHCFKPYPCPYFKYCTSHLNDNNVFSIRRMTNNKKIELYKKKVTSYSDLLKEDIDPKFKQQIEFELYDKEPYINTDKINEFLKEVRYPLYFLDFETFQQSIPMYDDVKPYMQIPFQYSLHYLENENSSLKHTDFLGDVNFDPRRMLAEKLVKDIPLDSCIVAYNMMFEKMVIKNLASMYSDLSNHLMNIHDNMIDLLVPFRNRDYYVKEMNGSYSIKYVLPALFPNDEKLNYHNLELIHNGSEAMNAFYNLNNYSKEEQTSIRNNLLKYCELDTYAMVKIWEKLKEVTKIHN